MRYAGEPVVAVVAETRELARDVSELVEVEYEPLPVVVDARLALDPETPLLHEECGTNRSWSGDYEWGDLDAAFAEADHVVRIKELHFDRFNSTPLELNAALVEGSCLGCGQLGDPPVRERAEAAPRRVGLVDDPDAVGVDGQGAVDGVRHGQRHSHAARF